jgi:hypothetical protein
MTTESGSTDGSESPKTQPFLDVLGEELRLIRLRRGAAASPPTTGPAATPPPGVVAQAQDVSAFGVAFSGGGIRSATFNLGVAQGLAERNLWPLVDYLSTVSGGGYIGTWLHGVTRSEHERAGNGGANPPDRDQVFAKVKRTLLAGIDAKPGAPDADPIAFLRKYSNYLAPKTGLFSADTWVGGVVWVRNVLLNQLILAPIMAAVVTAAILVVLLRQVSYDYARGQGVNTVSALVGAIGFVAAIVVMALNLKPIARRSITPDAVETPLEKAAARVVPIVPLGVFLSAIAIAALDFAPMSLPVVPLAAALLVTLMLVFQAFGGFVDCFAARHPHRSRWFGYLHVIWMAAVAGLVTTALIATVWNLAEEWQPWHQVAYVPSLMGLCMMVGVMLLVGLMGADYPDAAREWTARLGSRFAMVLAGWALLFALTIDGPPFVAELVHRLPRGGPVAILMWIGTTFGGVLAGRSPETASGSGKTLTQRLLETLVNLAPTLFLIAYVVAIAAGAHALLASTVPPSTAQPTASANVLGTPDRPTMSPYTVRYWEVLSIRGQDDQASRLGVAFLLFGGFVAIGLVAGSRVNINEFSLHHFYKNRLVRCYLGASRSGLRKPNWFTGFDPADDFPIAALRPDDSKLPYYGPYAIVTATLNLNAGSELAQQERKASSFVFTPAYSGFERPVSNDGAPLPAGIEPDGYRLTRGYSQPSGPAIGTAMAISGAAANPNSGYHTSGPMAFLLTVFNARLGWWLGNPRWPGPSEQPGPVFALRYLVDELLGQTTGVSKFVNLSDGGHFDNLGLYELVRRRCRFIIVCDAEEDGELKFGSLGDAIRRCRADFGVEINIDPAPIRKAADGDSTAHCVVGRIRYPEPEGVFTAGMTGGFGAPAKGAESRGWIFYLKSSLTGDEPADVIEYHSRFREFPHQSTADQFFTESQFESYRRLGLHVLRSALEGIDPVARETADVHPQQPLVRMFQNLTRKWYAPIPVTPEAASRLADAYVELLDRLAADGTTLHLFNELQTGQSSGYNTDPIPTKMRAAVLAVLQLMENVFTEFNFEHSLNLQNPRNEGWINAFRTWVKSPILYDRVWPGVRDTYHRGFQEFISRLREQNTVERDVL